MNERLLGPTYYTDAPSQIRTFEQAGYTSGYAVDSFTERQPLPVRELLLFARHNGDILDPSLDRPATVEWADGSLPVDSYQDGADTLWVRHDASQVSLTCTRGDDNSLVPLAGHLNSVGVFRLDDATLTALAGGVSSQRGDVVAGTYRAAQPEFWWTANTDVSRFAWDGAQARWRPLPGGSPENLGYTGTDLVRVAYPDTWEVGQQVPVIRVGSTPSDALPGYLDALVVADVDLHVWGNEIAVLSVAGDVLVNPQVDPGLVVWYCAQEHKQRPGRLETLWLTPALRPYETPLLRIGNQSYLETLVVETETLQDALTLLPGQCSVARDTGRVLLSQHDQDRLDPSSPRYLPFLTGVWSDGVVLGTARLPAPVALTNNLGAVVPLDATTSLYLPVVPLTPFEPSSGILTRRDGTLMPMAAGTVATRPNGTGLVRYLGDGVCRVGDTQLSVNQSRLAPASTRPGLVHVVLEDRSVSFSWQDRQRFAGQVVWYTDTCVRPTLTLGTTVWSLDPVPVITWKDCTVTVRVSGGTVNLSRTSGQEDLQDFVAELDALLSPLGASAGQTRGHLWISDSAFVEIGHDVDAAHSLRILPGSRTGSCPVGFEADAGSSVFVRERDTQEVIRSSRVLVDVSPLQDCYSIAPWRYHAVTSPLEPLVDIVYRDRYAVLTEPRTETRRYTQPVVDIPLEAPLVPESVRSLEVSTGGVFETVPYSVVQGNLRLEQKYGDIRVSGFAGVAGSTFSDPNVDLAAAGVEIGDWLEMGSLVTWISSVSASATLYPPIPTQTGVWKIRKRDGDPLAGVWFPLIPVQETPSLQVQIPLGAVPSANPHDGLVAVLVDDVSLTVVPMQRQDLGVVGGITLPTERLAGGNFRLVVGDVVPSLRLVADLLSEPPLGTVDYLVDGQVRWATDLLTSLAGGLVQYQETAGQAPQGSVEIGNGTLAYSVSDAALYSGAFAWGVLPQPDYRVSPTSGRIQFPPMPAGARLAAQYRAADQYGNPTEMQSEIVSFPISRETAVWVAGTVWSFAAGRTPVGQPVVWVDGLPVDAQVNLSRKLIQVSADPGQSVQISYHSLVAVGGETNASLTHPVSWGTVVLPQGSTSATVDTTGLEFGGWIDLGGFLAVIQSVDGNTCHFLPATPHEIGSRETGVSVVWQACRAISGWRQVPVTIVSAEVGHHNIIIEDPDLTEYLVLDGQPVRVIARETVAKGQSLRLAFPLTQVPTTAYRLVGTIAREGDREIRGLGSAYDLTVWRGDNTWAQTDSAQFDSVTGNLLTSPVTRDTRIAVSGTGVRVLAPRQVGDQVYYPRVRVTYAVEQGGVGKTLVSRYRYAAPDSLYAKMQVIQDWIAPSSEVTYRLPVVSVSSGQLGSVSPDALKQHERTLAGWRAWRSAQMLGGLDTIVNPRVQPFCVRQPGTSRYLWNLAWNQNRGSSPLWLLPDDPLVTTSASLLGDRLVGTPASSVAGQEQYRLNDLADQFVPSLPAVTTTPWGKARYPVVLDGTVDHPYNRVLPTETHVWGDVESPLPAVSQTLMPLSSSVYPVTGVIREVVDRPRWAEIVQYSPTGFGAPFDPQCLGKPCFLLAINPSQFPKYADGSVDLTDLVAGGGDIPDLTTGDVSPAWLTFAQGSRQPLEVSGTPLLYFGQVDSLGQPLPVYVSQILDGCVVTLAYDNGTSTGQEIVVAEGLTTPSTGTLTCQSIAQYVDGVDFRHAGTELRAMSSLNSPQAGQAVDVRLSGMLPVIEGVGIPSLDGLPLADDGDQPAQHYSDTRLADLLALDTNLAGMLVESAGKQLLPDPYRLTATVLPSTAIDPVATLIVTSDTQESHRPLAQGDLLVIPPGTDPQGLSGWQEVALVAPCVSGQAIHLPRWVTSSRAGDRIQYTLDNFAYGGDLTIQEVGAETVFTFVSGAVWNDGSVNPTGGLNSLVDLVPIPYPNNNEIILSLFDPSGVLVETVTLQGALASGGAGGGVLAGKPTFYAHEWRVGAVGFVQSLGTTLLYATSVDCWQSGLGDGSRLGRIASRVQFLESYDLSFAQPAGAVTPAGVSVETRLDVKGVLDKDSNLLTVNSNQYVNAGTAMRFRTLPGGWVGTFTGGVGTLTAPSVVRMGGSAIALTTPVLALPGCTHDNAGVILLGHGYAGDSSVSLGADRITGITASSGGLGQVETGDVVYVDGVAGQATVKQGTYHVHHAVTGVSYREDSVVGFAGSPGMLSIQYPLSQSYASGTLVVDAVPKVVDENDVEQYAFSPSGRVWLVRDLTAMSGVTADGVVSASYTGRSATTFTGLADWRDGNGNPVLESVFAAAAALSVPVAGHRWVQVWTQGTGLEAYQTSGYHNPALGLNQTVYGFREITLEHVYAPGTHTWNSTDFAAVPAVNQVGVKVAVSQPDGSAVLGERVALWDGIPRLLDLSQVLAGAWAIPFYGAAGYGAILPGTKITTTFRAQSGIFLEPSSPRPLRDLGSITPRLVNQHYSLSASERGMRDPSLYGGVAGLEQVRISVRRMRPHSTVARQYGQALRSIMRSDALWSSDVLVHQYAGSFAWISLAREHDIVPGDVLRSGDLWAQVVSVQPDQTLITTALPPVPSVTLWRRRPSIEQALEECLETLGRVVLSGVATANTVNQLVDPNVSSFVGLVEVGDIVVIDPAGSLATTLPEQGDGPHGDTGVPGRAGYLAGSPSSWDDNRGFYRVTSVGSYLGLDPNHGYLGTFEVADYEYAIYPLASGANDLRVTETKMAYAGSLTSVPNTYRVIRPDSHWAAEVVDLVLQERERHLTWLDLLGTDRETGTYRATRLNNWAEQVWRVNRPAPGWISDEWIASMRGEVTIGPYLSNHMSVNILERRFWAQDPLLESTGPGPVWTDRLNGRGGLLRNDRIAILIEPLREETKRWIRYITNRLNGRI